MTVEIYIAVLLTVVVLALVAGTVFLAMALWQVRRLVRLLEFFTLRLGDKVSRAGDVVSALGGAALAASGGLGKTAAFGAGLLYSVMRGFRRKRAAAPPEDSGKDD
jgi:hypothetical protein